MRDKFFLILLSGFAAGVLFRSFCNLGFSFSLFLLVIGAALFLFQKTTPQTSVLALSVSAIFLFAAAVGALRFDLSDIHKNNPALRPFENQELTLRGVIVSEPDEREDSNRLTVMVDSVIFGDKEIKVSAKMLAVVPLYPKFNYGDRVEVRGLFERPQNFADPSGKVFDYQSYLAVSDIYYEVSRANAKFISAGSGNVVVTKLFELKHAFLANVSALIPEPHASLLGGLVVGAKRALGQNLLDDFRRAGVIHIVVLSGYNITIVAEAIIKFFGFLPRMLGQTLGAIGIILFAIMTGGSATVVRASIMALLVILARNTSRRYDIVRALLLAGFLMILQNPKILVFDSSFQLSFMSTIALIYVSPILEKRFTFITEKFGLRSVVVATLSTQIFVLPMLLYKMGELSIVALPVNLLILFVIPTTMLFGFLAGAVGFVSLIAAFPFAWIAYALLEYELKIVEFFSHLPFASVAVDTFPLWFAVLIYVFYLVLFLRFRPKLDRQPIDIVSNLTNLTPV